MISYLYIYKFYKYKAFKSTIKDFSCNLRSGFKVFIGILAPNLYNSIPFIIVGGFFASDQNFTSYAIAMKVTGILFTIQNILSKSFYPIINKYENVGMRSLILANIGVTIPLIIFIIIFGRAFLEYILGIKIYNEDYLYILSFSMLFVGLANSLSIGFLLPNGFDDIYRNVALRVSIISAIITFFCIYKFGILGCAISLLIARMILFIDYYKEYIKLKDRVI